MKTNLLAKEKRHLRKKKNPRKGVCIAFRCRKPNVFNSNGVMQKCGYCHSCYQAYWRLNNPHAAYYRLCKDHAKERRIPFFLTLNQFTALLPATWWFGDNSWSLDRIEGHGAYELGNVAFIPLTENIAKGNRERYLPEHIQDMIRRRREAEEKDHNQPF